MCDAVGSAACAWSAVASSCRSGTTCTAGGAPLEAAETVFSSTEIRGLKSLSGAAQCDRFFSLWTLKEAYIKARGMGMSLPVREITFDLEQPPHIRFTCDRSLDPDPSRWSFQLLNPDADHFLAVAWEENSTPELSVRIRRLESMIHTI